jgi:chromosome segregation ATPase
MMNQTLDSGQLENRVEWIDRELRNDKTTIASLQSKIDNLDNGSSGLRIRVTDIESEMTRIATTLTRLDQYDQEIASVRKDLEKRIEELMSAVLEKQVQTDKNAQEIGNLELDIRGLRKNIQEFDGYDNLLESRKEEDIRLGRLIEELKAQVNDITRFDDDYKRTIKIIEENRRQDTKRITDIQGEVAAIRKRQDEVRGKQDLVNDNMRKLENHINDLVVAESERKESQTAFIEKLNMAQVNYERTFKQWAERFETMEQITSDIEEEVSGLENIQRAVKQSQSGLDEATQRFDRRVNEITEVQRLNEDRFRQEWTTFKSDYQKRWSNYSLSQEEQFNQINRDQESLANRITNMEETIVDISDNLQQLGKDDIKRMKSVLAILRESLESYEIYFKA